mmetsp:Transcript_89989/g.263043  ORF Transcript_89989/g.263043 Transcript_89989/m.263043 type:complete len:136 (-) Transcript_89989:106-513(-)
MAMLSISSPARGHWGLHRPVGAQPSSSAVVLALGAGPSVFSQRRRPAGGGGMLNNYTLAIEDPPPKGHKFRQPRKCAQRMYNVDNVLDREVDFRFVLLNAPSASVASERLPGNCQMQVYSPKWDFVFWERARFYR